MKKRKSGRNYTVAAVTHPALSVSSARSFRIIEAGIRITYATAPV